MCDVDKLFHVIIKSSYFNLESWFFGFHNSRVKFYVKLSHTVLHHMIYINASYDRHVKKPINSSVMKRSRVLESGSHRIQKDDDTCTKKKEFSTILSRLLVEVFFFLRVHIWSLFHHLLVQKPDSHVSGLCCTISSQSNPSSQARIPTSCRVRMGTVARHVVSM